MLLFHAVLGLDALPAASAAVYAAVKVSLILTESFSHQVAVICRGIGGLKSLLLICVLSPIRARVNPIYEASSASNPPAFVLRPGFALLVFRLLRLGEMLLLEVEH